MAQHHTDQRQRGNAALQQATQSTLPLQTSLQVSRKLDCTKPPIKDAQQLPCCAQGAARAPGEFGASGEPSTSGANAAPPAIAAPGANAAPPANAALQPPEKITCLTPSRGIERLHIVPSPGIDSAFPIPPHGTMRGCFGGSSIPSPGNHLEKPSVPEFKPRTSEKFSTSPHADCSTTLKGKQPNPFTGGAALCYIAGKPRGPVCRNAKSVEVAAPTVKRGFVMPRLLGQVRQLASSLMVTGGMGISARTAARLRTCYEHPVHLLPVVRPQVVRLNPVGTKTMTATTMASRRAAPSPTTAGTPDLIQLHADAHNALNMAVFYLRQPDANVAGARRKAIQALSALRGLSLALEG